MNVAIVFEDAGIQQLSKGEKKRDKSYLSEDAR